MFLVYTSKENAEEQVQPNVLGENTYVKVIGNIRTFGGKRSIAPFKIKPITDMNDLTLHMLETVHTHMLLTKRKHSVRRTRTNPFEVQNLNLKYLGVIPGYTAVNSRMASDWHP